MGGGRHSRAQWGVCTGAGSMNECWQSSRIGSVLVASAFPGRAGAMAYAFARHGLGPTLVFSTTELAVLVERRNFDLVMVDGGMPGIDDTALVRGIVTRSDAAAVLVGGSDADADGPAPA